MKSLPTQHRSCHGHFHKRVSIDIMGSSAPKRKAQLILLSELQNHRCAYCGTDMVFWWEFKDLVAIWNSHKRKVEQEFQKRINDIKNLAVFEYFDYDDKHNRLNTFISCQECRRYRTRGSDLHSDGIHPQRFWQVRADPERWSKLVGHFGFIKIKAKKKNVENQFQEGVGHKLDKSTFSNVGTLVALDLEWHERDSRKILEVGLTRFTKEGWLMPKHIIIREYLNVKNRKYVPNKKDQFHHGWSQTIRKNEAAKRVLQELSRVDGVVVHGGRGDLTALQYIGVHVDKSTVVYDTQKMFSMMLGVRESFSLGRVSKTVNHDLQDPHNAGNDAYATAKSFIGMRKIIEAEQKLSYTGRIKSGNLVLDSVEICGQDVDMTLNV